jgi:UDP-glucose:tetrahydrobiopterin glucosyltransferase
MSMPKIQNKLLFIAPPVGHLGSGEGGGTESMIYNLSSELFKNGFKIDVLAPKGGAVKNLKARLIQIPGDLEPNVFSVKKNSQPKTQQNGVLKNMWAWALKHQPNYSKIISFSYDRFSFEISKNFNTPIYHFIGVTALNKYTDKALKMEFLRHSERFAFMSKVQFKTFNLPRLKSSILGGGVSLKNFKFGKGGSGRLVFAARISPEKNLEFALKVAKKLNMPLDICGKAQDEKYYKKIVKNFPKKYFTYHGFLNTSQLSKVLRQAEVSLFAPKVVEAFALSAVESLASGTPIAVFPNTGPAEIVETTKAGVVSKSKSLSDFAGAVLKAKKINRQFCRQAARCFEWKSFAKGIKMWIT